MLTLDPAKTIHDITPTWLTQILHETGLLPAGTHITTCDISPVGTGQMGDVARATIRYSDPTCAAPSTLIAKLASSDETSRKTALALNIYQNEINFFKEIAPSTQMAIPNCYYATIDPVEGWVTIIMEDIGGNAKQGDVLVGGTVDQAAMAFEQLALLQAPFWNDTKLAQRKWLAPEQSEMLFAVIPPLTDAFLERFADKVSAEHQALIKRIMPHTLAWYNTWSKPRTISHGDFRLDNMMLATNDKAPPMMTVDWQTVKMAPPTLDIAYYMGACLSTEDRRNNQTDLLKDYHGHLTAAGIDYAWNDLWDDFRRYSIYGLVQCAYAMKVEQTERGDNMFAAATRGYADMALDLDAAAILGV